ncbi:hypothetical protein HDA45_001262 [Amycolatopsis umgeniensis]|uniref:Uncharacterized protein n=1 Tax=Amycolatopsis umgeniensis TaxID=336628 RepID=A0A841AXR3_9PSEU|nr:hypothetical protein [Amycolatopsis umgeniensis]
MPTPPESRAVLDQQKIPDGQRPQASPLNHTRNQHEPHKVTQTGPDLTDNQIPVHQNATHHSRPPGCRETDPDTSPLARRSSRIFPQPDPPIEAHPIATRTAARDHLILPIMLNAAGQPLDVGRLKRFVTPAQRRTLDIRNRGCAFPAATADHGTATQACPGQARTHQPPATSCCSAASTTAWPPRDYRSSPHPNTLRHPIGDGPLGMPTNQTHARHLATRHRARRSAPAPHACTRRCPRFRRDRRC